MLLSFPKAAVSATKQVPDELIRNEQSILTKVEKQGEVIKLQTKMLVELHNKVEALDKKLTDLIKNKSDIND